MCSPDLYVYIPLFSRAFHRLRTIVSIETKAQDARTDTGPRNEENYYHN